MSRTRLGDQITLLYSKIVLHVGPRHASFRYSIGNAKLTSNQSIYLSRFL